MKERSVAEQIRGFRTQDGAGVSLVRVLGHGTKEAFDPILMLDSFDSRNPEEYVAGFPMHPHRGIETVSYVYKGRMTHRDSLGNEDTIGDGEVQWMTAGSGILHEEKLPPAERMLGVQLWLNLPARDKMAPPAYKSIKRDEIPEIKGEGYMLRLLAGTYQGQEGYLSKYLPLDYYDIHLEPGTTLTLPTEPDRTAMIFTLEGEVTAGGQLVGEKSAARLTEGEALVLQAGKEPAQVLFMSSRPLREPIAWGGPIVMNTREELNQAFLELETGRFIRDGITY